MEYFENFYFLIYKTTIWPSQFKMNQYPFRYCMNFSLNSFLIFFMRNIIFYVFQPVFYLFIYIRNALFFYNNNLFVISQMWLGIIVILFIKYK